MRYQLSEIRNNTTLDDLLGAVAEKVGFVDPIPYTVYFADIRRDHTE